MTHRPRIGAQAAPSAAPRRVTGETPRPWQLEELPAPAPALPEPRSGPSGGTRATAAAGAEELAALRDAMLVERARAVADAHARGRQEGLVDGEASALARLADAFAQVEAIAAAIREQESRFLSSLEENLAALAVSVARHVIDAEVRADPTVVETLVRRALEAFPQDRPARVHLHPDDLARLRAALPTATAELQWVADATVQPGGCVVEGRERLVDGRVDTALERIFRHLARVD